MPQLVDGQHAVAWTAQIGIESGSAIAVEHGVAGVVPAAGQQVSASAEAVGTAGAESIAPLRFTERQDPAWLAGSRAREYHDVDLDLAAPGRVGNDSGADLAGQRPEQPGRGELPAQLLEVRPEYLGREARSGVLPYRALSAALQ